MPATPATPAQIGFIGLGHLGLPIATHLLDAGHTLTVYNRTAHKADPLVARCARLATQPADAVPPGGIVFSLLWDDASVDELVRSPGFLDRLGGGIHVAMTTVSPAAAQRLAALHAERGASYVEATIFGRPEAAAQRQLWIPYAGPAAAKARIAPLLTDLGAQGVFDLGAQIGAASTCKLVGNFLIITMANAMREGLGMADKAGFDAKAIVDMLTRSLFDAPIFKAYGARVTERAQAFAWSNIPLKDLGLFEATAEAAQVPSPIAHVVRELLRAEAPKP